MNVIRSEVLGQHRAQGFIRDLAVEAAKPLTVSFAFNLNSPNRRRRNVTPQFRARQQNRNLFLWQQIAPIRLMSMPLVLAHQRQRELRRRRNVLDVPGINVAANLHSGDLDGSNRTLQFFEIIRRNSLITIVGCERPGEIKTVSCPTRGLIEIMFFFQQRIGGDVFEDHAVFFQALALFVRIKPIARSSQRKAAFDHSRDEDAAKTQSAHVRRFQHAQAVTIGIANQERLRI